MQEILKQTLEVIREWILANQERIIRAYMQKGGWEGWAQVEIALALSNALGIGFPVLREVAQLGEQNIYQGGNRRADIAIAGAAWNIVIELKTESVFKGINTYVQEVNADWDKMKDLVLGDTVGLVLGISVSDQALAAAKAGLPNFNVEELSREDWTAIALAWRDRIVID